MLFAEQPIYPLNGNKVERLKVSLIKISLDNIRYESYPRNDNFYYLSFNGDEILIARKQIYHINDDIVERFINGSSVYV